MSRFRTAALGAVVVLGMAGVAGAQTQARPDSAGKWNGRHGQMGPAGRHVGGRSGRDGHGKFMKDLNLSEAQKNQVKAINAKYASQMKTTREQRMQDIRAILTADQRTKWDAAQAQRKQHMEVRMKGMKERGARRGNRGKA